MWNNDVKRPASNANNPSAFKDAVIKYVNIFSHYVALLPYNKPIQTMLLLIAGLIKYTAWMECLKRQIVEPVVPIHVYNRLKSI